MSLLIRLAVNAATLWVAALFVDGVHLSENRVDVIIVAVIFGLVNTFIRPVVTLLSPPALLLTIDGSMSTLVGGLTVTVVSFALNLIVKD